MSNETTENFWQAWHDWQAQEVKTKPPEYRLYHDENGYPLVYSMEELPGNYILLDQATWRRTDHNVRVIDGKLVNLSNRHVSCLRKSDQGVSCHPSNVSVVVDETTDHQKWRMM